MNTIEALPASALEQPEFEGRAWVTLLTAELQAKSAQARVVELAELLMHGGLPFDQVLHAMKLTPDQWVARVAERDAWKAANIAAADRMDGARAVGQVAP